MAKQSTAWPDYFEIKLLTSVAVMLFLPSRGHAQRKTKTVKKADETLMQTLYGSLHSWWRLWHLLSRETAQLHDQFVPHRFHPKTNSRSPFCSISSLCLQQWAPFIATRAELGPLTTCGMWIMSYLGVMCCIQLQVSDTVEKIFPKVLLEGQVTLGAFLFLITWTWKGAESIFLSQSFLACDPHSPWWYVIFILYTLMTMYNAYLTYTDDEGFFVCFYRE